MVTPKSLVVDDPSDVRRRDFLFVKPLTICQNYTSVMFRFARGWAQHGERVMKTILSSEDPRVTAGVIGKTDHFVDEDGVYVPHRGVILCVDEETQSASADDCLGLDAENCLPIGVYLVETSHARDWDKSIWCVLRRLDVVSGAAIFFCVGHKGTYSIDWAGVRIGNASTVARAKKQARRVGDRHISVPTILGFAAIAAAIIVAFAL